MPSYKTAFGSYIKAEDLGGRQVRVTIERVAIEEIKSDNKSEKKLVAHFAGKDKGLVLNKTNANAIAAVYGDDSDNWEGAEVDLYPAMVQFKDKMVEAIRVKVPPVQMQQRQPIQRPAPPAGTAVTERDPPPPEDVPF